MFMMPDKLSFVDGAFMACAAGTTYLALNKLQARGTEYLAVIGLGSIGLSITKQLTIHNSFVLPI